MSPRAVIVVVVVVMIIIMAVVGIVVVVVVVVAEARPIQLVDALSASPRASYSCLIPTSSKNDMIGAQTHMCSCTSS